MISISNIDSIILIQVVLIFLAGGIVKGLIGVGLPTVTLTLLSFVFDIKDSISIILIPVILTNFYQMLDGNYLREIISDVKFFLIGSFLFIFPILIILLSLIPRDATFCPSFEQRVPFKSPILYFFFI